jgi:hypothetical protein
MISVRLPACISQWCSMKHKLGQQRCTCGDHARAEVVYVHIAEVLQLQLSAEAFLKLCQSTFGAAVCCKARCGAAICSSACIWRSDARVLCMLT